MILHKTDVFLMAVYQANSALQLTKGGRARYASPAYHRRVKNCGCTDKNAKKTHSREAVIFFGQNCMEIVTLKNSYSAREFGAGAPKLTEEGGCDSPVATNDPP